MRYRMARFRKLTAVCRTLAVAAERTRFVPVSRAPRYKKRRFILYE